MKIDLNTSLKNNKHENSLTKTMSLTQKQFEYLNELITDHIECNYEEEYEKEKGYTLDFIKKLQNKLSNFIED